MRNLLIPPAGPIGARTATVAAASRRDRYHRWVAATTLGELVGFTIPALVGAAVTAAGLRQAFTVVAMVLAGTGEEAVLGWAQSRVLRRELPDLRAADWVRATAAGAALAWLIGMTPSSLHDTLATWPLLLLLPVGLLAGAALLATIGVAQWTVLRRHVGRSAVWVAANALGWVAGLVVFFTAIGLAPAAQPRWPPPACSADLAWVWWSRWSPVRSSFACSTDAALPAPDRSVDGGEWRPSAAKQVLRPGSGPVRQPWDPV